MKNFSKLNTKSFKLALAIIFVGTVSVQAAKFSQTPAQEKAATIQTTDDAESLHDVVVWMMSTPKCKGRQSTELSEVKQKMLAKQIERILTNIGGDRRAQEAFVFLMCQESQYRSNARSPAGALGIAQLMPATAQAVANQLNLGKLTQEDLLDSETNIILGYTHFRDLVQTYSGNLAKASAAYNGGPAGATIKAMRTGGIGAAETDAYVRSMFDMLEERRIALASKE